MTKPSPMVPAPVVHRAIFMTYSFVRVYGRVTAAFMGGLQRLRQALAEVGEELRHLRGVLVAVTLPFRQLHRGLYHGLGPIEAAAVEFRPQLVVNLIPRQQQFAQ